MQLRVILPLLAALLQQLAAAAGPHIVPDWAGREPQYPPGSLYWRTREYRACAVVYRTVIDVSGPVAWAAARIAPTGPCYAFLNGEGLVAQESASAAPAGSPPLLDVELTHALQPGPNVLALSAGSEGFALAGGILYPDGRCDPIDSEPGQWRVQKLPPLTILELEPWMRPRFDDSAWFDARATDRTALSVPDADLAAVSGRLADERLHEWDEDARWRLQMLDTKGFAIVDGESRGWAGGWRLPDWVRAAAASPASNGAPGALHARAEALTRCAWLIDEAAHQARLAHGYEALGAEPGLIAACRETSQQLGEVVERTHSQIDRGELDGAVTTAAAGFAAIADLRARHILNAPNRALDNKFSWFDTTAVEESEPRHWGLRITSPHEWMASPLSPASLVRLDGSLCSIAGWTEQSPLRIYNRQTAYLGPTALWAVANGQLGRLEPAGADGTAYEATTDGALGENWLLLVEDMTRGGRLPIQIVLLDRPTRIAIRRGEGAVQEVTIEFSEPGARLFLLQPMKEWRGFLATARILNGDPGAERDAAPFAALCRMWSHALLDYPVSYSEAFARDPGDPWALRVADVYDYWTLTDEWGTEPLRLAPLPPLATYGLMLEYPGLAATCDVATLASRGTWGDYLAAADTDTVTYRVPLDPFPRFGGFTSYCFGPTDIGEPGGQKEIETIRLTGANSFRPQHNQTGARALRTVDWCAATGIQCVFNIDEKWVLDAAAHYAALAESCRDYPPGAVAYDLLNEPETREPRDYAAFVRKLTTAIRRHDARHVIYVEAVPPWGPGAKPFPRGAFESLEPTGDPRTVYSFHDYAFRLGQIEGRRSGAGAAEGPARWPGADADMRDIAERWIPALRFAVRHRVPIHLGEFGGFEQVEGVDVFANRCAFTMTLDFLEFFEQFGWHWHYYSNRGTTRVRRDGSLEESQVQRAHRRHFARGTLNIHRATGQRE